MATELKFSKNDSDTTWGFRLTGGIDHDLPLIVLKVTENSLAENCGLHVDDIIVRINDTPTSGLTHNQAHDLLHVAGNEFVLGIRRGDLIQHYLDENSEIENILERAEQNFLPPVSEIGEDSIVTLSPSENLAGKEQIINPMTINKEIAEKERLERERKWSTFLQKPKNPVPPKKLTETQNIEVEPYKVIIKKQKRKSDIVEKHVEFKEEIDIKTEEIEIIEENGNGNLEVEVEISVQENEEIEVEIEEGGGDEIEVDEENIVQSEDETTLTLEQQLAEVQKQLQALSQLPSAIQVTLDAVTQQLKKIVKDKLHYQDSIEERDEELDENDDEKLEEPNGEEPPEVSDGSQAAENDISESLDGEDFVNDGPEEKNEESNPTDEENKNPNQNGTTEAPYEPTEEEKEAKRIEEEQMAKKQKEMEHLRRPQPLKPIQRPIILPGGRRWSDPNDACPKTRNPKMTDEKIATTIETYSEVLIGKAKGINFLKYQPPPKNLDYLQRSDVYRLVHDMEPPVRGISTRAEKLLSEQDYYGEPKGAP